MDKKWYLFEGDAEGGRADMALLSEEEAEIIKRFFKNKICFHDEGYAGNYDMSPGEPFDSKEELFKAYRKENPWIRSDDVCDEFKDMCKEEKE